MSRVVSRDVSDFYEAAHARAGVNFHFGCAVAAFSGQQRVDSVITDTGTAHACDCVVVGIGIEPAAQLAARAGLACDNGIVVDAEARTSDANVLAAGDCTSHPNAIYARRVRLESVHNAIEQGKTAALSLLDRPEPYTQVPWFWSDQYDLKLQIAGLSDSHDAVALRGDPRARRFAVYYLRAGRLIAVDAINSPRDFIVGKRLIASRAAIDPERIADTTVDLDDIAATPTDAPT
jgi:3-phenylpropionate/trans-cinnamate dioxygenase ferredoxin reductase subunit